jgi:putative transcriptional regulator
MAYKPIEVNRENLTILGVPFPDLETLESAASAIGTNMFEGFEPTVKLVQFYLNWRTGKINDSDFLVKLKEAV